MEKEILGMTSEEIYSEYKYFIEDIYKRFKFLGISKNDYQKLALRIIEKSKKQYDGSTLYHVFLREKIVGILFRKINKLLNDDDKAFAMLSNYIKINFEKPSVYSYAALYLKNLSELFSNSAFFPDPELIIRLIGENVKFSRMLDTVVKNHIGQIEDGSISNLFDESAGMMIQAYCEIHNIKGKSDIKAHDIENIYTTDSVRAYLNEVADIPLLTEQEQIKYGYMLLEGSEEAKQKLIEGNLCLAVTIAARYVSSGMSFADLIQDANEGLIRAVSRYDVRRGYHFSTYAAWWITCRIKRALELNVYRNRRLNPTSLNELVNEDGDTELGEFLIDDASCDDNNYILTALPDDIRKLFADCKLTEKETAVLTLIYGLGGNDPMTLEAIGHKLGGVTRERVRQIEALALKKIRMSPQVKCFAIYLDNPDAGLSKLYKMRSRYAETKLNSFKRDLEDMITVDRSIR